GTKFLYDGRCLTEDAIPVGFFANESTGKAEPCAANVARCTGPGTRDALECGKNKKGDQYFLTSYGDCRLHCQYGWYGRKDTGLCYACSTMMAETCTANGPTLCLKDASEPSGRLVKAPDGSRCVPSGSSVDGYYLDAATGTYQPCDDGVATCTGVGEGAALTCDVGTDGTQYYMHTERMLSMGRRVKRMLKGGVRPSPSITYRGLYVYNDCVEGPACEAGTYPNATTAQCEPCHELWARTCDDEGKSLTCLDEMWSLQTEDAFHCVPDTQCKELGAYYPADDYTCKAAEGTPTSCLAPYYLYGSTCIEDYECQALGPFFADEGQLNSLALPLAARL
ncbi:hypothetical protein JCM10213_006572, partial [Rhodosporidiobolus nylandii]